MAAASGEKDGFSLGPQLFFAFSVARGSRLGARSPANPYYSVPFAPSFILFSPARGSGLGARNPTNPYYSVPFAPSFILFSPPRGAGLGARSPANPYYSVPFAPSFILFSPTRGSGLGARNPLTLITPFPLHQVPPTFPHCGPPAGGFQPPRGCRICLYMCTKNLFYFVYIAYFLLHLTNS